MKKILMAAVIVTALMSCGGGALDGKAGTDTTSMPTDTSVTNNQSNQVNRSDGTMMNDTVNKDKLSKDSIRKNQSGKE